MDRFLKLTRYHAFHMILLEFLFIGECSNMAFMVFAGHLPTTTCRNITDEKSVCKIIAKNRTACTDLKEIYQFFSIAIEWNLFCHRVGYIYLITSVQMAGLVVGAIFIGQLSDKHGRRRILIPTSILQLITGALTAVSTSWQMFAVFRFLNGFFLGGQVSTSLVLALELIPKKHRLWASMLMSWSPMYIVFAGLAYTFSDWRKLALFANLASAPGVLMLIFAYESPLWLIEKQKYEKAKVVLITISGNLNNRTFASEIDCFIENEKNAKLQEKDESDKIYQLCYDKNLLSSTAALCFVWFSTGMINYSLLFNVGHLSGSIYLNMALFGAIRYSGNLIACLTDLIITKRFKGALGTKVMHAVTLGGVIMCLITVILLMWLLNSKSAALPIRSLNLASVSLLAVTFLSLFVITAQIYPTKIRNVANGVCQAFSRLGATVAPQTIYLGHFWTPATYILLAFSAVVQMCLLCKFVPETRKKEEKIIEIAKDEKELEVILEEKEID